MSATPPRPHGSGSVAGRFHLSVLSMRKRPAESHPCVRVASLAVQRRFCQSGRSTPRRRIPNVQQLVTGPRLAVLLFGQAGTVHRGVRYEDVGREDMIRAILHRQGHSQAPLAPSRIDAHFPASEKQEAISLCQPKAENAQLERGMDMTAHSPSQNQHVFETDRRGLHARLVGGERAEGAVLVPASPALAGP